MTMAKKESLVVVVDNPLSECFPPAFPEFFEKAHKLGATYVVVLKCAAWPEVTI
jgi:hypothetical protein